MRCRRHISRLSLAGVLAALTATFAHAEENSRFWLLWEQIQPSSEDCPLSNPDCTRQSIYARRMFAPESTAGIEHLFMRLSNHPIQTSPEAANPPVCQAASHPSNEIETRALSDRLDTLRGITAVGVNLTRLRPPPGQSDAFGKSVHQAVVEQLRQGGIKAVSPKEARKLPGQPQLKIYLSFVDPNGNCTYGYSIFATLTQTVTLTRDPSVKIEAGVWSHLDKVQGEEHRGDEAGMIRRGIEQLLSDWRRANASGESGHNFTTN